MFLTTGLVHSQSQYLDGILTPLRRGFLFEGIKMRLAIIGSRTFNDYERLKKVVDEFRKENEVSEIVSGGARGADALGAKYAKENNITLKEFNPDFSNGFRVGQYFERNKQIVVNCDVIIGFWDSKSRGTAYTLNLAKDAGKKVIIEEF